MTLAEWIIAASLIASLGQRRISDRTAEAMAQVAAGDYVIAAIEVSLAWFEAANLQDPRGSGIGNSDHGQSWCWGQVYLPGGGRTREGWTGPELAADPLRCATVVVRLVKVSVAAGPADCPLCIYARGRDTPEARRLSAARMTLAHRLLDTVPR